MAVRLVMPTLLGTTGRITMGSHGSTVTTCGMSASSHLRCSLGAESATDAQYEHNPHL